MPLIREIARRASIHPSQAKTFGDKLILVNLKDE
jgi:hypothetical protein